MTAQEMLNQMIINIREGSDQCLRHINSYTPNASVLSILQSLERAAIYAKDEIEKGNAK